MFHRVLAAGSLILVSTCLLGADAPLGDAGTARQDRPAGTARLPTSEAQARYLARARQEQLRYKGTVIRPALKAPAQEVDLQARVAAMMNTNDFVPAARTEGFRWIGTELGERIVGWQGFIQETRPVTGGHLITVGIHPQLSGLKGIHTTAYTTETYKLADGKLEYVDSNWPPTRGVLTFP